MAEAPEISVDAMLAFKISSGIALARLYVPQVQSVVYPAFPAAELPRSALRGPVVTGDLARLAFGQSSEGMACEVEVWIMLCIDKEKYGATILNVCILH